MELKLKYRDDTLHQPNDLVKEYVESLKKEDVFYDLGACVGTYGILAYSLGCKVVAFEVDKVNFDAMNENFFYIFGFEDNFKTFNIGIADKEGIVGLKIGQPEIGGHHKTLAIKSFCGHPNAQKSTKQTKTVKADSLDNLIKKYNLPNPDHIKVDIDGSEYAFLFGAQESLRNAKSIIIELYEENEYFQKIVDTLEKDYNFKLYKKGIELEAGLRDYWFEK